MSKKCCEFKNKKIITRACSFNTQTYDLGKLISGTILKITKDGNILEDISVKLDVGTNIFLVDYTVDGGDSFCEIRIARRNKHRVVFNTNDGSFIETQYVADAQTVSSSSVTPTRNRYTFLGWFDKCEKKVDLDSTPITEDTTFIARWDGPNTFVIPDKATISYKTSSAALNVIWKDYETHLTFVHQK